MERQSLGDLHGYDALQDWAAENYLTPREAVTILASAQTDPPSAPWSWSGLAPASPPHASPDRTAPPFAD